MVEVRNANALVYEYALEARVAQLRETPPSCGAQARSFVLAGGPAGGSFRPGTDVGLGRNDPFEDFLGIDISGVGGLTRRGGRGETFAPDLYAGASLRLLRPVLLTGGGVWRRARTLPDGLALGGIVADGPDFDAQAFLADLPYTRTPVGLHRPERRPVGHGTLGARPRRPPPGLV